MNRPRPDFRMVCQHLWDQRVDSFVLGVLTGLSSHVLLAQNQPRQSFAAIGLFAAFAVSSTFGHSRSAGLSGSNRATLSSLTRQTSLAMVAAIAGWLIGSVR